MKYRGRVVGEAYRPKVTVLKTKNSIPTVVKISGLFYQLQHEKSFKYQPPRYVWMVRYAEKLAEARREKYYTFPTGEEFLVEVGWSSVGVLPS